MNNAQSKELTKFYKDWYEWATAGVLKRILLFWKWGNWGKYNKGIGLCHHLIGSKDRSVLLEMKSQFNSAGLDDLYPFGGYSKYQDDIRNHTMHKNPERLKWVKDHIQ